MTSQLEGPRYNVLRIKDPSSLDHTVLIYPGQEFEILLSDDLHHNSLMPFVRSDFFEIYTEERTEKGRLFKFKQKADFSAWSKVSTSYLGEIKLARSDNGEVSCLCVYLISSNPYKTNIVTIVNPDNHTVKINPNQIIEVILYNPLWGQALYWDIDKNDSDPRMELLAHTHIVPSIYDCKGSARKITDAFFTYPRAEVGKDVKFCEFHIWMRCDQSIASEMKKMPNGSYPAAKLKFRGINGIEEKCSAELKIVFSSKPKCDPTADRVATVTFSDSDMADGALGYTSGSIVAAPFDTSRSMNGFEEQWQRRRHQENDDSRRPMVYNSENAWQSKLSAYGARDNTRSNYDHWTKKRVVTIKLIDEKTFGAGCKMFYIDDIDLSKKRTYWGT